VYKDDLARHAGELQPPITAAAISAWSHVLAPEITVSGSIPQGQTTANVTYFVVDRARNAVVGNITLPDASTVANSFRLNVRVPQLSDNFDVGTMSDDGEFVSAGFTIETLTAPTGAVGQD
jgi:pyridoxine/pyridoxamine 5'-phosphate oxidase